MRIAELLRKKACTVRRACTKTQGRKRQNLDINVYKLCQEGETESLETLKEEVDECEKNLDEWEKYADLENEKKTLYNEMKSTS